MCLRHLVSLTPRPLSSFQVINFYAGANQSMNVTCVGKVSLWGPVHLPICLPFLACTEFTRVFLSPSLSEAPSL